MTRKLEHISRQAQLLDRQKKCWSKLRCALSSEGGLCFGTDSGSSHDGDDDSPAAGVTDTG
jgi:hypothetical protein